MRDTTDHCALPMPEADARSLVDVDHSVILGRSLSGIGKARERLIAGRLTAERQAPFSRSARHKPRASVRIVICSDGYAAGAAMRHRSLLVVLVLLCIGLPCA